MNVKLTLSLDKKIIERAKKYARKKNVSLSKLVETHLSRASAGEMEHSLISPLVKSLSGIIKLSKDAEYKKGYADYLSEKYK